MKRALIIFIILSVCSTFVSCGQRGELYLPLKNAEKQGL